MGNSQGRPVVFTDQVNLDHFKLLRVVGKGAFGKVRIVERKDTGLTFALKYIRKDEVVRQENVRNIIRERKMLEHLNHPFLCNLRYSFQDYEYLYLVVDLMNGGDLRFHIQRKTFEERAIRFWVAELGCALRYVHSQGIVHRDVKPDNVLLDSEGHVHLADFNVAADYTNAKKPLTSKSGTLAYLAPEVYDGGPYKFEVDWWGLGVVMYECVYGKRPFEARHSEELGRKVQKAQPKFPVTSPQVDTTCESAVRRLLSRNLHDRIGANGFENFTQHPFMLPIDFIALEAKRIPPVFVPSSEKTNFDATYDLEELLLEEAPLEARARHQKPRPKLKPDASDAERRAANLHEMIETYFEPFDYTLATFEKLPGAQGKQSRSSSTSQPSPDATHELETTMSDDPNSVVAAQQNPSGPPSPTGSPPLSSQVSLPNMNKQPGSGPGPSGPPSEMSPAPSNRTREHSQPNGPADQAGVGSGMSPNARLVPPPHQQGKPLPIRTKSVSSVPVDVAAASATLPNDARKNSVIPPPGDRGRGKKEGKQKGIAGLLGGKKRTGKSPAPTKKYPEGVLGKEGARVWVRDG